MIQPTSHRSCSGLFRMAVAAVALLALSGCASVFLVDNQVQSYARWSDQPTPTGTAPTIPQAPQVFRFDRLPSQQDSRSGAGQDELEKLAAVALAKVGWTPAAAGVTAPWTVEVSGGTLRLTTQGSTFDTLLGGYSGSTVGSLSTLGAGSKTQTSLAFLNRLHDLGHAAADQWLTAHRSDIGQRSSHDIFQALNP